MFAPRKTFAQFYRSVPGRVLRLVVWTLLGAWTALALYFTVPSPFFSRALAIAVVALFVVARRPAGIFWRVASLGTAAVTAVWFFVFVTPNPDQVWETDHAQAPHVEITGDKVRVTNARSFIWRSATDFTPRYVDRVYDVSKINSMYYLVVPLRGLELVAHVFVGFGFTDGQYVAISVEGRRVRGRPYRVIASMFRQYEMIYVIGDEQDIVGKRGAIWQDAVRFYPARTTPARMREVFLDMVYRAHALEKRPEFYHLIFNNCMNNVTRHLRKLGGRPLPNDWRLLLTGDSDRLAYEYGFIDTDLPFAEAREVYRVDDWIRRNPLDETFSPRLREYLRGREKPRENLPAAPER